jgi:hypothetical protein
MAKSQAEASLNGTKKVKEPKSKDRTVLVGRVKKVVKKSRRKLSEEKFEKELQRTITFLEQLQAKLGEPRDGQAATVMASAELADGADAPRTGKKDKKGKKKDVSPTTTPAPAPVEATLPGD